MCGVYIIITRFRSCNYTFVTCNYMRNVCNYTHNVCNYTYLKNEAGAEVRPSFVRSFVRLLLVN